MENLIIEPKARMLFVYPHPDDETYFAGGLIQHAIKKAEETVVVCLTKGEASTLNFTNNKEAALSDIRSREFVEVMKIFSVKNYELGSFRDGGLKNSETQVYDYLKQLVEKYKPSHLITFEPHGVYGHPDHIALSNCVKSLCNRLNIKLIYTTVSKNYRSNESSLQMAEDPEKVIPLEPNARLMLTPQELITKIKALKAYKSQIGVKQETLAQTLHQVAKLRFLPFEYFTKA
ncbi:PIG-L family deacetylase [Patescibacteria group bacterium]|nr:PIG-L family deacetylase [Patescibacteria group bacterium]